MYENTENKMSIIQHLEELRRRIIACLVFFLMMSVCAFIYIDKLVYLLKLPAAGIIETMIFLTPTEVFISYIRVALIFGFIASLFFILIQAWLFLKPAIPMPQRNAIKLWLMAAFLLVCGGAAFSYFLALPFALKFLIQFAKGAAIPMISIGKYFSFVSAMLLIGAGIFQIPIVIGILSEIGIVNPRLLNKNRKYAIVGIAIASAIITPTQDMINMLIFSVPMWLLYEAGVAISWLIERRKGISS